MSAEILKLRADYAEIKSKLDQIKEKFAGLEKRVCDLKDQNAKWIEENEMFKEEKCQNKQTTTANGLTLTLEETTFEEKADGVDMDIKLNAKMPSSPSKSSISVPNWLIEVLAWIKRIEMADSALSTSCWAFKQLCWPKLHANVTPYKVKPLTFFAEWDHSGILRTKLKGNGRTNIPIAKIPPPEYIIDFMEIKLDFLDGKIVQFFECISPHLNEICLSLFIKIPFHCFSDQRIEQIRRFIEMLAHKTFALDNIPFFEYLRFYPNANTVFANVHSIKVDIEKKDINLLLQWLNKARPDPKPKMVQFKNIKFGQKTALICRIKKQFTGSTSPANFIIRLDSEPDYANFTLKNNQTGETLVLYPNGNPELKGRQYLLRHAQGQEHLRADWENQIQGRVFPIVSLNFDQIREF